MHTCENEICRLLYVWGRMWHTCAHIGEELTGRDDVGGWMASGARASVQGRERACKLCIRPLSRDTGPFVPASSSLSRPKDIGAACVLSDLLLSSWWMRLYKFINYIRRLRDSLCTTTVTPWFIAHVYSFFNGDIACRQRAIFCCAIYAGILLNWNKHF